MQARPIRCRARRRSTRHRFGLAPRAGADRSRGSSAAERRPRGPVASDPDRPESYLDAWSSRGANRFERVKRITTISPVTGSMCTRTSTGPRRLPHRPPTGFPSAMSFEARRRMQDGAERRIDLTTEFRGGSEPRRHLDLPGCLGHEDHDRRQREQRRARGDHGGHPAAPHECRAAIASRRPAAVGASGTGPRRRPSTASSPYSCHVPGTPLSV